MFTVAILVFFLALAGFVVMSLVDSFMRGIQGYRALATNKSNVTQRPVIRLPRKRAARSVSRPSRPIAAAAA